MSPALTKVKWLLTLAAMVLFGALGLTYTDRLPWVLDGVGIFSDQARIKAQKRIDNLKKQFHKEMMIETIAAPPKSFAEIDQKNEETVNAYFKKWAIKRAKSFKVNGIFVLICANPKKIKSLVGTKTRKSGLFTQQNLKELTQILQTHFKEEKFDEGLAKAISHVEECFQANQLSPTVTKDGTNQQTKTRSIWGTLIIGLVIVLVVWMVISLFRAANGYYAYEYYGDRGGFWPGFFAAFLGVSMGVWFYNAMTGYSGASPQDFGGHDGHNYGESDYYSSDGGGDWGGGDDFGGGGDFGGDW